MKVFSHRRLVYLFVFFLFGFFFGSSNVFAINRLLDGYKAVYGTPKYIDGSVIGGVCKKVTIPSGKDMFIGTKSIYEWASFISAAPRLGITLDSCLDCKHWSSFIKTAGGSNDDFPNDITTDSSDTIYITGYYGLTANVFGQSLTSTGLADAYIAKVNSGGQLQWVRGAGGNSTDEGLAVAVDSSGSVYVGGEFSSTGTVSLFGTNFVNSGSLSSDAFLTKFDTNGNAVWTRAFGTSNTDTLKDITVDTLGNVYAIGSFRGTGVSIFGQTLTSSGSDYNLYISKFNSSGTLTWTKRWGNSGLYGHRITTDSSNNLIVSGLFYGTAVDVFGQTYTSSGGSDTIVAKLDSTGTPIWVLRIGNSVNEITPPEVAVDYQDNIFVGGSMQDNFFSRLNVLGQIITSNDDAPNAYIAKVNSSGTLQWVKNTVAGLGNAVVLSSLDMDEVGNVIVSGDYTGISNIFGQTLANSGSKDIYIAKLSHTGGRMWVNRAGGTSLDIGKKISVDTANNTVSTSTFGGNISAFGSNFTTAGNTDILLMKITPGGVPYDSLFYVKNGGGSVSDDNGAAISLDSQGNRYLGGSFSGTTTNIFSGTLNGSGGYDIFVAKIDQNDNISWVKKAGGVDFEEITSIQSNNSGSYVGGNFYGYTGGTTMNLFGQNIGGSGDYDGFISALSSTGGYIWSKKMGGTSTDVVRSIALDPTGNIYLAGSFMGTGIAIFSGTYTSSGFDDAYVAKMSSGGTIAWVVKGGGTGSDSVKKIAYHPDGSIYVLGQYSSSNPPFMNGTGNALDWRTAGNNIYVARLNATTGLTDWSLHIGGDNNDNPQDIAINSSGTVYILGYFKDQICYLNNIYCQSSFFGWIDWNYGGTFIAELSGTSSTIFRMNNYYIDGKSIQFDQNNSIVLVDDPQFQVGFGYDFLSMSGISDIAYAKLNSNLFPEWVKVVNSPGYENHRGSILDSESNLEIIGNYSGSISYYGNSFTSSGGFDIFSLRLPTNNACEAQTCGDAGTYYGYIPDCSSVGCGPNISAPCFIYLDKCSLIADGLVSGTPDVDCDAGGGGGGGGV